MNCQKCGLRNLTGDRYCAKCGHPLPSATNSKTVVTVIAVVGGLALLGLLSQAVRNPGRNNFASKANAKVTSPQVKKAVHIDKSPDMQKKRRALIQETINRVFFAKVESDNKAPFVWVRPAFYAADFDMKQQMISVVYAYYCDGTDDDMVILMDALSGKSAGFIQLSMEASR
jgi:hypothetical protein